MSDLTGGPQLYAQAMAPVLSDLDDSREVPPPLAWLALLHRHAWEIKRLVDAQRPLESQE